MDNFVRCNAGTTGGIHSLLKPYCGSKSVFYFVVSRWNIDEICNFAVRANSFFMGEWLG